MADPPPQHHQSSHSSQSSRDAESSRSLLGSRDRHSTRDLRSTLDLHSTVDLPSNADAGGTAGSGAASSGSRAAKPFLGVLFRCCNQYARIYRRADLTAYEGKCPRCGKPLRVPIGSGGTGKRFFGAQ